MSGTKRSRTEGTEVKSLIKLPKTYIIETRHYHCDDTEYEYEEPQIFISTADFETIMSETREWTQEFYKGDTYGYEDDESISHHGDDPRGCGYLKIRQMVFPEGPKTRRMSDFPAVLSLEGSRDTIVAELTTRLLALRRNRAAVKIQRKWLELYYDPRHRICKARLHREWLQLNINEAS